MNVSCDTEPSAGMMEVPEPAQKVQCIDQIETIGAFVEIPSDVELIGFENGIPPANDGHVSLIDKIQVKDQKEEKKVPQFPDIEGCIPRWKKIFPWVCWCSEDNVLYCLHCRELLRKSFPDKMAKSNVVYFTDSDKVFTAAKLLRKHHESLPHIAAIYLYCHSTLISFVSLFNNHYKDMKFEEEVMGVVRSMFNYSELSKESFVKTIIAIGGFIEKTLVNSLKDSRFFSVVADQCRGIIILRWINASGVIEEHVFWSYLNEWNMTPMQYLKYLGLTLEKMTLYVANSLCQHCSRCQNLSVMPASLPPRPPSILSFAGILWNLDFLRPLMSLFNTIYKLFKIYPYKFAKKFNSSDLRSLFSFNVMPSVLIKVMDDFDEIKKIAVEIYESRSYVEALGLSMVQLKNDDQHRRILLLLQEIMDTVREVTVGNKITEEQIVKLNQAFGSLKNWSHGASFVTHGNQSCDYEQECSKSDKVWEFLTYVEKFIDENQKTIYYNGKDRTYAFINICCLKVLLDSSGTKIDEVKLFNYFNTVFDVYNQILKTTNTFDKMRVYKCVKNFYLYLLQNNETVNSCIDIMRIFHADSSLKKRFPDALEILSFCGTMPFQSCQVARSLFVSFVIEQRIESSVWVRLESNEKIKPWLLYVQHELNLIPERDLLQWWLECYPR